MFKRFIQNLNKKERCVTPINKNLPSVKILILSDFHMASNDELKMLSGLKHKDDYDICLTLGDICAEDLIEIKRMVQNVHGITGNHDSKDVLHKIGIDDLHGKRIEYNGLKIVGLSGSFKYKDVDGFSMIDQRESILLSRQLLPADIFITHDSAQHQITDEYAHQGLAGITEYIHDCKPAIHLYGHHHENRFDIIDETNSFCTYKCNILDTETMKMKNIF